MTHRVVLLDPATPERMEQIGAFLPDGYTLHTAASRSPQDQLQAIAGATYAITGGVPVTAEMMKAGAASKLRAVHKWGVGYDNIDIESARSHGIRVMRTTGSNATAVAETAVGLILAAQRNIVAGHLALLDGEWAKGRLAQTCTLVAGKTVGLVGLGHIGKSVARILRGFGCTTLYSKPTALSGEEERELGVTYAELPELLDRCDVISLHCALTSQTSGLIDAAALARMKRGAYLVNTARGGSSSSRTSRTQSRAAISAGPPWTSSTRSRCRRATGCWGSSASSSRLISPPLRPRTSRRRCSACSQISPMSLTGATRRRSTSWYSRRPPLPSRTHGSVMPAAATATVSSRRGA